MDMTKKDSSKFEIEIEDEESGNAKRTATIPDVVIIEAMERLLGENGRENMFRLIYTASRKGKKLIRRWYEHPVISFVGFVIWIAIAVKVYFF